MPYVVGVDIGGTFTDATAVSVTDGRVLTAKSPTTSDDLVVGLLNALELIAAELGLGVEELLSSTVKFAHGTTQTSNVIFTWRGAKVGVITTRGFRDELLIMRAIGRVAGLSLNERRHLRATDKPPQVVPPELIREVDERVDARGRVVVPLSEESATRAIESLLAADVDGIVVSLLWSPRNPDHELRIREMIGAAAPDVHVTLAHELAPVIGEYERVSTAAINAFVAPTIERYLDRLESELRTRGLRVPLLVLQASGGVVQADDAVPVHTVESGPAAGLVASAAMAEELEHPNVIATDVGGTTFKVGLIVDGRVRISQETVINQYALLMPMVDLVSIGAGGGSIAWADDDRLHIGPISAGSDPGPACYGWGGTEPTVTDADAVLGFLAPENFMGGRLALYPDRARTAFEPLARRLFDGDVIAAAAAVRTIVDSQMGGLLRKATIERGLDPGEFVLYAYGGAGPLHAAGYARGIGVTKVVVPRTATVFSAHGAALSDLTTTRLGAAPPRALEDIATLEAMFAALEEEATAFLENQDSPLQDVRCSRWVEMRYTRQLHHVRVPITREADGAGLREAIVAAFSEQYAKLYGRAALLPDADVDILRVGVDATGAISGLPRPSGSGSLAVEQTADDEYPDVREVFWPEEGRWIDTDVHVGDRLRPGASLKGPAVIEGTGTTIAVPPDVLANVDAHRNVILDFRSTGDSYRG